VVVELSGEELAEFFETVLPHLNERQRRVVAGRRPRRWAGRGGQRPRGEASSMGSSTTPRRSRRFASRVTSPPATRRARCSLAVIADTPNGGRSLPVTDLE